jgi:hypothetical protein
MLAATLRDNPMLTYALLALIVLFVILLARIFVGRRVASDKRPRPEGKRREPGFSGRDLEEDYGPRRDGPPLLDEGGRYGFRGLVLAFVLGIVVGYGGLALTARPEVLGKVRTLAADLLSDAAQRIGGATTPPGSAPEQAPKAQPQAAAEPPPPAGSAATPPAPPKGGDAEPAPAPFDRNAAIASFVERMKRVLPKQVDAATTLVRVDADDDVITLGFSLAEVVPPESFRELGDRVKTQFNDTVCKVDKPGELRVLNDAGVTFWIVYSDQVGTTVARLLIAPKYCDKLEPAVSPR